DTILGRVERQVTHVQSVVHCSSLSLSRGGSAPFAPQPFYRWAAASKTVAAAFRCLHDSSRANDRESGDRAAEYQKRKAAGVCAESGSRASHGPGFTRL